MARRKFTNLRPETLPAAGRWILGAIVLACCAVELALQVADLGLLPLPRLRGAVLEHAAFWPGLLRDWQATYPLQQWVMFFSYGFLHGGILHLVLNMVTLVSLARPVIDRLGTARFVTVYVGAMIGGGAVYGLLATSGQPMVGASGALFGLAGAIMAMLWEDQPTLRAALRLAGRGVALLVGLNVIMYVALGGMLAWQAHLGGFLAGWILTIALDPPHPAGALR